MRSPKAGSLRSAAAPGRAPAEIGAPFSRLQPTADQTDPYAIWFAAAAAGDVGHLRAHAARLSGLRDAAGATALMHASANGRVEAARLLARTESRMQMGSGVTALMLAAKAPEPASLELIRLLAPQEGRMQMRGGDTALVLCARLGLAAQARELMAVEAESVVRAYCAAVDAGAAETRELLRPVASEMLHPGRGAMPGLEALFSSLLEGAAGIAGAEEAEKAEKETEVRGIAKAAEVKAAAPLGQPEQEEQGKQPDQPEQPEQGEQEERGELVENPASSSGAVPPSPSNPPERQERQEGQERLERRERSKQPDFPSNESQSGHEPSAPPSSRSSLSPPSPPSPSSSPCSPTPHTPPQSAAEGPRAPAAVTNLLSAFEQSQERLRALSSQLESFRSENASLRSRIADLEASLTRQREKGIGLAQKNTAFFAENQRLRKTLADREAKNRDLYSLASDLATRNEKLQLRLASSRRELRDASQSLSLMRSQRLSEMQRTASLELEAIRGRLAALKAAAGTDRPKSGLEERKSSPETRKSRHPVDESPAGGDSEALGDRSLRFQELR